MIVNLDLKKVFVLFFVFFLLDLSLYHYNTKDISVDDDPDDSSLWMADFKSYDIKWQNDWIQNKKGWHFDSIINNTSSLKIAAILLQKDNQSDLYICFHIAK